MAKRRANGEGNIRKRADGRWEGRYTAGHDPVTGKQIFKNVLGKTQAEVYLRYFTLMRDMVRQNPYIDTLAHACKNICKIIESCEEEEEYSSRSMRGMSRRMSRRADPMYESYDDGMSGRRDNRGRFAVEPGRSYHDGTEEEVERLMQTAKDERTRRALQTALQSIRG